MNEYKKKKRKSLMTRAAVFMLAAMVTLTACGAESSESADAGSVSIQTASVQTTEAAGKSEMFTERDLSGDYDESQAVVISLNGSSAEISSENASGTVVNGSTITITEEGTYVFSGSLSDGKIIVDADDADKVQIVLKDASVTSRTSAALYVKSADKVFVTTAAETSNTLANGGSFTAIDESNIDGAVFAKDDITFNGRGELNIVSPAGHGVVGKDDVKFGGGTYTITAAKHGVQSNDSVRAAESDITITANEKDGIHVSDDDEETPDSYFYIADGTVVIAAGDDGIHADGQIIAEGGTIMVTKSYEGIEALSISISGGEIDITASDDGLNAAGGSSAGTNTFGEDDWNGGRGGFNDGGTEGSIVISGGSVRIAAGGDSIDSNGSVEISGGYTVAEGPSQGDTSVLDYNSTGIISGGVFIGTGGAGMAENFSSTENQGVITLSVGNQSAGSKVTVTDSDGTVIAEVTPDLDYAVVYISTPDVIQGKTYTVTAGTYSETIELTDSIYSTLGGGMAGNGLGGGGPRGMMGGHHDANTGESAMPGEKGV